MGIIMEQGQCPCCEGGNLEYGTVELEGDQCYYPWTCPDCGAQGEEWYAMEFISHTITAKGDLNLARPSKGELEKPKDF